MTYQINGTVTSSGTEYFNCLTYSKLKVRAYSVGFGTLTDVGNGNVNDDGTFSFDVEADPGSIMVKLFYLDPAIGGIFVAQSDAFCHHDTIKADFEIDEHKFTKNMFTEISIRLNPFVEPIAENIIPLTNEQIKELSCLTCVSVKMLKRFQAAYRLHDEFIGFNDTLYSETEDYISTFKLNAEVARALLFGLVKDNYDISLADVFTFSGAQFAEILMSATDRNEIPGGLINTDNKDMIIGSRNGLLFNAKNDASYYDAKLIHLSDNNYADKKALLNDALNGGGLSAIIPENPKDASDRLKRVMPLLSFDQHLMHFPPMLDIAVSTVGIGTDPNYYELTLEGPSFWEDLIITYPSAYATEEDYALAIYNSIAASQPSARLSRNLGSSDISDATNLKLVLDNFRDFNINEHSVSSFFSTVNTDPNYLAPDKTLSMQSLQRSVKLSGDTENLTATKAMLNNDLSSSYTVTRKGKAGFTDLMVSAGVTKEVGEKIYCRAAAMNSTISMLMAQYKRYESPEALLPFSLKDPDYTGDPLPNLPDLESLFGNLDTCNCSECQSVYSPAAYLTDLLHWLGTSVVCTPVSSGRTGFKALMQTNLVSGSKDRRKDIRYLKLNCKNTNTLIPYIDLVNEILSVNLLTDSPAGYTASQVLDAYKSLQTTKTAEELLTEPEHRFSDADEVLRLASSHMTLPYDPTYDESVSYLAQLEKPYPDLVRDFISETDQYNRFEWAFAYLGFNPYEFFLVATAQDSDPDFWKKFWNLESIDLLDNAVSPATPGVGAVLKYAGISLSELKDILSAYYINGLNKIELVPFPGDECNIDRYTFSPKFTIEVADRFMRFLRLRRKTGLSTVELDLAIINHSPGNGIDMAFLTKLASCMAFAKKYNLKFTDVEMFYTANGYVDHFTSITKSEYFKNKFLNSSLPEDVISFFTTNLFLTPINSLTIADKQKLATVFQVGITEIESVINYAFSGSTGGATLNDLAIFDRYTTMIKALKIPSTELKAMLDYAGNPFLSTDIIKAFWTISARHDRFNKLDIKLTELLPIIEMNGNYSISDPDMLAKAENLWTQVEKAYALELKAHPEIEFDSSTSLPVNYIDEYKLMNVIADHIRIPFGLSLENTINLIHLYSQNTLSNPEKWLSNFVKDPKGILSPRLWSNRSVDFMPVYQLLTRASLMATISNLSQEGLQKTFILRGNTALSAVMNAHFFWHTHYVPSTINIDDITWVQELTEQTISLGIPQEDYLGIMVNYRLYPGIGFTAASDSGIVNLHSLMGVNSYYKDLSVAEFTQTFLRSQIIDDTTNDLVLSMRAFNRISSTITTLGCTVSDGWKWVWGPGQNVISVVDVSLYSSDIRRVLHNKYPNFKAWSDMIVPVQNGLRLRLRDALVAYYIGSRGFKNENAIYAYYLLDTQMAPCNQTSRVVSAVSAAQLLVHRALLGIEADVCMDEDDKNEWEWRKNYRVWEANRKVFLYPENWIDPSLRNNKTTIFKNTEDLLQQDEINQHNSELAFAGYLTNLNDVAHLDIRATYMEVPESNPAGCCEMSPETLHVFARSWNPPYIHYYRTLKNNVWTAWEKMELETDSDHLVPVMFNRKLYVFFPMFIEKQHQIIKDGDAGVPYLEIKMCYTKLDFGKWSNKKVLNGTLQAGSVASINIPNTEAGLINKLGRFDPKGRGNGINSLLQGVTYRGNLVWDCNHFKDFAYVSLKKESFYFWPEVDKDKGDLMIHCRRDFADSVETYHDGYSELAYEWGFKVGACDEKVEIAPPVIKEPGANDKRFLARPYMTLPYYQQMKYGKDFGAVNTTNDGGLWSKTDWTHGPGSKRMLKKTNGEYVLTYPAQFKDNMNGQPYFFADKRHSMYINTAGKFSLHEHPFTCKMLEALNRFGIEGLLNSKDAAGLRRQAATAPFFPTEYSPTSSVSTPYPIQNYDFSSSGAYSIYNWEVFFHTVSLIARQLRQSNKFEDALKWINYIFDPANRDMSLQDLRYWKIKPFLIDVSKGIPYYMRLLSAPNLTAAEKEEKKQWEQQIEVWRDHPFDPHLIASMRPRAYMLWTVMELIDILSDWADYLFRQDTTESINEAINLYVLASEILGERPKKVDRPLPPEYSYDDIINGLNAFSNASARFENYMTGLSLCKCKDGTSTVEEICSNSPALSTLPELGFCIPDNPRMTQMWDRVEDRLYKIRNCMNIDGKKRQLALFAPPIDPALLVRATAMGLDLSDVLSDLAAAPPHYRFSYLLQRANEFTNEVKSLGSQLLIALEKKDGEELSVLRQIHEQNILKASRALKEMQLEEAKQNYSTLQYSKNLIQIRLDDYKNREYQNSREQNAQRQTQLAEGFMYAEQGVRLVAGLLNLIPDLYTGASGLGPNTETHLGGGQKFSVLTNAGASALGLISSVNRNKASMSLTYAGYDRRQEEWTLQVKSATEELLQIDRQLLSAEIRIAISEKELENHDLQVEQSAEMYDWLKTKYTNQALYTWMAGQLKTLHRRAYDMAYDMAKLAQQAFFKDLGTAVDTPKINFGNWDSSRAGFFAGERLSLQLKELETSYIQHNTRDYELNKTISLALLDPMALEDLKTKGFCDINIPELLFDLDYPGHYFRKIRSVALSIPGIAGPYTTIAATLTLNNHAMRKDPELGPITSESGYGESIATSSAQNDSGVFELNFRDERYMPFEHKGAVSSWRLELSQITRAAAKTIRQFDFNTISDVIMHMSYTAKSDGVFAEDVASDIDSHLNTIAAAINNNNGLLYAINLRHDMPDTWHQLKNTGSASINIEKSRLPYLIQAMSPTAGDVSVIAYTKSGVAGSYKINVANLSPLSLSKVSGTSVYKGTGTASIALNSGFTISTNALSGALPLSDTDEMIIVLRIAVA